MQTVNKDELYLNFAASIADVYNGDEMGNESKVFLIQQLLSRLMNDTQFDIPRTHERGSKHGKEKQVASDSQRNAERAIVEMLHAVAPQAKTMQVWERPIGVKAIAVAVETGDASALGINGLNVTWGRVQTKAADVRRLIGSRNLTDVWRYSRALMRGYRLCDLATEFDWGKLDVFDKEISGLTWSEIYKKIQSSAGRMYEYLRKVIDTHLDMKLREKFPSGCNAKQAAEWFVEFAEWCDSELGCSRDASRKWCQGAVKRFLGDEFVNFVAPTTRKREVARNRAREAKARPIETKQAEMVDLASKYSIVDVGSKCAYPLFKSWDIHTTQHVEVNPKTT